MNSSELPVCFEHVVAASDAELLRAYVALTARPAVSFGCRAVAELRVMGAIAASADAAGHLGVAKGRAARPVTHGDLVQAAATTRRDDPARLVELARSAAPDAGVTHGPARNPYAPGSLAARLWGKAPQAPADALPGPAEGVPAASAPSPAPAPAPASRSGGRVGPQTAFRATARPGGQPGSVRGQVLAQVRAAPGASLGELGERFGLGVARGCVQKLLATNHLEICP